MNASPSASGAPIRSIALMVASSGVLTVSDAITKWLTRTYPVAEVISARGAVVMIVVVAWSLARGRASDLRVHRWRLQLARGGCMAASSYLFVTALSLMPLADAIAIAFAGPILATVLAALLLREPVGWRRWTAIAVGFAGVLIMLRPTPGLVRLVALVPLAAALAGAFRDIVTRAMGTGGESTPAILLVSTAVVTTAGALGSPWGWVGVHPLDAVLFAGTGLLVGVAQALMIEAFRHGEVGLAGPFKYTSLVWAVILGVLVWGDVPGAWTFAGATLVVASGLYIWRRELTLARLDRAGARALPGRLPP